MEKLSFDFHSSLMVTGWEKAALPSLLLPGWESFVRGRVREAGERRFLTRRAGNQDTVLISQPQELLGFSNAGMPQFSCSIKVGRG